MNSLKNCHKVAYADDSYVINRGNNLDEVIYTAKENITAHTEALRNIGMIVNQDKTEIVVMSRAKEPPNISIDIGQDIFLKSSTRNMDRPPPMLGQTHQ